MIWKKSWFGIIVWAVCLLGSSAALIYWVYETAYLYRITDHQLALAAGCGVWLAVTIVFGMIRLLAVGMYRIRENDINHDKSQTDSGKSVPVQLAVEGFLFIGLLAVGLSLRIMNLSYAGESGDFYQLAKVTQSTSVVQIVHGATYYYLQLLHLLFVLIGNHWIAGIWMQIFLQIVAAVLLYFGIRKISGAVAAMTVAAFMMLVPSQVLNGITYGPDMLYLCILGVSLLLVAFYLSDLQADAKKSHYIRPVLAGMSVAFCCYLDISGIILLVLGLSGIWMQSKTSSKIKGCLVFLVSVCIFTGVLFALDAWFCGKEIWDIAGAWINLYRSQGFIAFWSIESGHNVLWPVVMMILVWSLYAYWFQRQGDRYLPWLLMLLTLSLFAFSDMLSEYVNAFDYCYGIIGVIIALGIANVGVKGKNAGKEKKTSEQMNIEQNSTDPFSMPKKHERKSLDFELEPESEDMEFDIQVSDNDDFDV